MIYIEDNLGMGWNTGINFRKIATFTAGISLNGSQTITGQLEPIVDVTTSTATLTASQSGSVVLLDRAAGSTVTLPSDAAGTTFTFVVATTVTSNSYKVIIGSSSSYFTGGLNVSVAAGTAKYFYGDGTSLLSINLNGTTTGGLQGGQFNVTCLKSGLWAASGTIEGSGTVATPFANS